MGRTCCLYDCKTNYKSEVKKRKVDEEIHVYRLPHEKKYPREHADWVSVLTKINANLKITKDTVVCSKHWPPNPPTFLHYGKPRPVHPPSVFDDIPASIVPPPPPPPRSTVRSSCQERNQQPDQLQDFDKQDRFDFEELKRVLSTEKDSRGFRVPFRASVYGNSVVLTSESYFEGIPYFMIKIFEDLTYDTYHLGSKVYIGSLNTLRVKRLNSWSRFEEALRFLKLREVDQHTKVLQQQIESMRAAPIGTKIYSTEVIIRAFEYFCTSRALYSKLRHDFKLPSITTLTRLTSKVGKLDEANFLKKVFDSLTEKQKICTLIFDEVYVKKMMLYHGGSVFGKAVNNPNELAKTVLGIMIACQYGGPVFVSKMLPVSKLDAGFVKQEILQTVQSIKDAGADVKVLVSDNNRVNQKFFKDFETVANKPWLTTDGMFLLFDFVHLIKSIRNNWITEKTKELIFYDENNNAKIAKWAHLEALFEAEKESGGLLKLSKLDEVAVFPKPIERQKVSTCLKVFCDETITGLLTHPAMEGVEGKEDTAEFLRMVVKFFKIMNVKSQYVGERHNDDREMAIFDPNDDRLNYLCNFAKMALKMKRSSTVRERQLTNDTAKALYQTCNGIVDLCRYLLQTSHEYVCIGQFTSDHIEKEFSRLRQGSGGTYFITVQQILEKFDINRTRLLASLNVDITDIEQLSGHKCEQCNYTMADEQIEIFDTLETLEKSMKKETKMTLVHIAGYVTRKDPAPSEEELLDVTTFYYKEFGGYTSSLDRGQLNVPTDRAVQWSIFCTILFNSLKNNVCRNSLMKIFSSVSEHYRFEMKEHHSRILSNILIKNFCRESTPQTSKETKLKVLKLS